MKKLLFILLISLLCSVAYGTPTPTVTPMYQMTVTTNAPNPVVLGQNITVWVNAQVIGNFAYGHIYSTHNNISSVATTPTPSVWLAGSEQWYNNQIINNTNLVAPITITAKISSNIGALSFNFYLVDYSSNVYPSTAVFVPLNVVTATATITLTSTATRTYTITPTYTITRTATPTITITKTSTDTATPSITRTITPTFTITQTATPTLTITETITPTFTETPDVTPTTTPTNTPFITPTIQIDYLSSLQDGYKDSAKVQCNKMNNAGLYTFYYGDYFVSVSSSASVGIDRVTQIINDLAYGKSYPMFVSFTSTQDEPYTIGSNVIDVKLAQTPTPVP